MPLSSAQCFEQQIVQKQRVHHRAVMVQISCPGELSVRTLQSVFQEEIVHVTCECIKHQTLRYNFLNSNLPKSFHKRNWMLDSNSQTTRRSIGANR